MLSNDCQVLCMGANIVAPMLARTLIARWLDYRFDPASASAAKVAIISRLRVEPKRRLTPPARGLRYPGSCGPCARLRRMSDAASHGVTRTPDTLLGPQPHWTAVLEPPGIPGDPWMPTWMWRLTWSAWPSPADPPRIAIRLDEVTKVYPNGKHAVEDIDLVVPGGRLRVPRRAVGRRQEHAHQAAGS